MRIVHRNEPGGLSEVEVELCLDDDGVGHPLEQLRARLGGEQQWVRLLLFQVLKYDQLLSRWTMVAKESYISRINR